MVLRAKHYLPLIDEETEPRGVMQFAEAQAQLFWHTLRMAVLPRPLAYLTLCPSALSPLLWKSLSWPHMSAEVSAGPRVDFLSHQNLPPQGSLSSFHAQKPPNQRHILSFLFLLPAPQVIQIPLGLLSQFCSQGILLLPRN